MWVTLEGNIRINPSVLFDIIKKAKKYIRPGVSPPKGVIIHTGKRGGRYYIVEDRHLKIQGKHHELVRGVGVNRDQWDELKQKFLSEGAKGVEFIPKPEYGKRPGDDRPRYNIYVNWGEKTQKKIEEKLAADKEKYGKRKKQTEEISDEKMLDLLGVMSHEDTYKYLKDGKRLKVGPYTFTYHCQDPRDKTDYGYRQIIPKGESG